MTHRCPSMAGLDVLAHEPPSSDSPILRMENVVLTPHSAGLSTEGVELRWRVSVETITALAHGRRPPSCVNPLVADQQTSSTSG